MVRELLKLLLYLLIVCALCICGWYLYTNHIIIPSTGKRLQKTLYQTENAINSYLRTAEKNACSIAELPQTKQMFAALSQDQNTKKQEKKYDSFLLSQQESMNFNNILLIDKNKIIRYATTTKDITGKQLTTSLKNTLLSLSYERAMMSLTTDFSEYGYNPLFAGPTLFICVPVIENKKFIGVLAYECNVQKITNFTNQFIGLGKTGEIVLAQESKGFTLFITPSRHDHDLAFKRKKLFSKNPPAIQQAVLGGQGVGVAHDYRGIPVIGAWTFIPKVNWGMIVKMDIAEAQQPLSFFLIVLVINLLCIVILMGIIEKLYNSPFSHFFLNIFSTRFKKLPSIIKNPFFLLCLISCALLINSIVHYRIIQSKTINDATQNIITDMNSSADEINQMLKKITFIAQSFADDLKLNRLSKDDIIKRMTRDLAENDNLVDITVAFAPYKFKTDAKLYGPTVYRDEDNSFKEETIEEYYDYTNPDPHSKTTAWYRRAIQDGYMWLDAYTEKDGEVINPSYSLAFFNDKKELQGVICIAYDFGPIERITAYSNLEKKGYSFLLSEKGRFIFHPIREFVSSEKTLLSYAQEIDNKSLAVIAQDISSKTSSLSSYIHNNHHIMWIYTEPIKVNNWILCTIFSKDDISFSPAIKRLHYFWMLIYGIITFLFACAYIYSTNRISVVVLSVLINILFVLGLIVAWRIIKISYSYTKTNSTIIADQPSLDKFLDDIEEEAKRKHEENPIKIPCGLLLYSLDMPRVDHMKITGYIWTKYNVKTHKNITHKITLPHATSLANEEPTIAINGDWETVTWNIRGTIYEQQHYDQFPFDKQQMQITIEHHDIDKNIILVPDLEDYKKISPEDTPGLDNSFTLSGFNVEETFFTYKKFDPVSNLGFSQYGTTTDHFQLLYNLVVARGLLSPFILYFLPLLVILFSLFAILLVSKRTTEPLSIIAPYSGLFFALVLLHRSLREQYSTGTTLYMEYAFFFAYITFIILVIHTVLIYLYPQWDYYQNKVFPFAKIIFWPFQLACWLITTFIIFY